VSHDPAPASDLRRQLGLWDAVAIFVGIILGSGIFVAPAHVAGAAPGVLAAVALWIVGGIVAACGAFCYAECGARLPRTGGFYVFYREVYGEPAAFIGGWTSILITYPASIAAIAHIFNLYLSEVLPIPEGAGSLPAAAAVLAAGLLNAVGVRAGARTQRVLTAVKVSALVILCGAAVLFAPERAGEATTAGGVPFEVSGSFVLVLTALMGLLWTYDGWSDVTLVAGELRRPGRNLGRTVVLGVSVLVVIYVAVQLSVYVLLPPSVASSSERVLSDAAGAGLGEGAGRLVALLIVVSTLGSINGIVLAASRIGFAMARDGTFLPWFGKIHPRWGTPARSIMALVAATLVYVFSAGFRSLLEFFSFTVWIFYALTAIALIVLRRRRIGEPPEWRAPAGWIAPGVVLVTAAVMTFGVGQQRPEAALSSAVVIGVGLLAWFVWRSVRNRS
jgi:APA family basic amino acid/polyamine antiporter